MVGQHLRQSLIERGVFHVDDHALDVIYGDQLGKAILPTVLFDLG